MLPPDEVFTVVEPSGAETPLLVEVPHAGVHVPGPCLALLATPARAVGRDADLYVDDLFADAPAEGATLLVARLSRYVVDLNRSESDIDNECVVGGPLQPRSARGLIWRLSSDGTPVLERPLTKAELDERVQHIYRPYHATLQKVLERKKAKFGYAILLAAHSMPSVGRSAHGDRDVMRADVVPGTRGRTTADRRIIGVVDEHAGNEGLTVRHDEPYRGGFSTAHYGRPADGTHAIQVELARRLYMDEVTLRKSARFDSVRRWCRGLVAKTAKVAIS